MLEKEPLHKYYLVRVKITEQVETRILYEHLDWNEVMGTATLDQYEAEEENRKMRAAGIFLRWAQAPKEPLPQPQASELME